jgi:Sulfotransferase family
VGLLDRIDELHETAAEAAGVDDFGAEDYLDPLRRLLADLDHHARLSELGTDAWAGEVVGRLVGRLSAQQGFKRFPQLAGASVPAPIVIIGLPRTGTTGLHRLMAEDPIFQTLPLWLAQMPMPRPPRETWPCNPLFNQVNEQIRQLYEISPGLEQIHPMTAGDADECRYVIEQDFFATGIAARATVPDYASWCLETHPRFAYERYKRVLGLIAGGDERRWILKNPDHIFALDALLDVFPDACIVHTHRDPVEAVGSVASLSYKVLALREPERTMREHGWTARFWLGGLEKGERSRARLDPGRVFDLHVDEFQADQVGAVQRIYEHFDLPVTDEALAAWTARAAGDPRSGHGRHDFRAEEFGIGRELVAEVAPSYLARYEELSAART